MSSTGPSGQNALDRRTTKEIEELRALVEITAEELEHRASQRPAEAEWLTARAQRLRRRLADLQQAQSDGSNPPPG